MGFYNIENRELDNGEFQLSEENKISLIEGSVGVILTLLSYIKPVETDWVRQLLII